MILNVVPLSNGVFFPNINVSFDLDTKKYVGIINKCISNNEKLFLVTMKKSKGFPITEEELYKVGVSFKIFKVVNLSEKVIRVFGQTSHKYYVKNYLFSNNEVLAEVELVPTLEFNHNNMEIQSTFKALKDSFYHYHTLSGVGNSELFTKVQTSEDMVEVNNIIAYLLRVDLKVKQEILEEDFIVKKMNKIINVLITEIELLKLRNQIVDKAKANIEENQKKYFLREQIKVINEEIGDTLTIESEVEGYREKLAKKNVPTHVYEKIDKELNRLSRTSSTAQEAVVIRDYVERVIELPWNESEKTEENNNIFEAEKILNNDHFGLTKVKERIIEFLAVEEFAPQLNSPILCLVGPPGVGKTSIAKSIANASGRIYKRIALGGIRDEADIRGHRKTYIGAMPGRIINAISQAKVNNPLILLDEIDKMGKDFKGDPASAMLEVLDGEQNSKFTDHYIALEFDLSKVLFVCTANSVQTIPDALRDRLEIIQLSSYTVEEKLEIGKKYLLPKQMKKHNLTKTTLKIKDEVIREIIESYTKEAGVRGLERELGSLCRKVVTEKLKTEKKTFTLTSKNLASYLGKKKFFNIKKNEKPEIGIVRGLAYTQLGGVTLSIEANKLDGSGKIEFTGNLGKIMQESAKASISYIRGCESELGIESGFYKKTDIHIHIPEGATPKDGPSAGVGLVTAMVSVLTNKYVKHDVGMTGEITIRGRVLPIGGLKEKILAGKRAGLNKIFVPYDNKADYEEFEKYIKDNIEIVFVKHISEILDDVLLTEEEAVKYECK